MASSGLPSFALFPITAWRDELLPDEWVSCLNAWLALIDSHLSLSDDEFLAISAKDQSLPAFLSSFAHETAQGGAGILGSSTPAKRLLKDSLQLTTKLLQSSSPPSALAQWEFLADLSRLYGKKKVGVLLSSLSRASQEYLDASLAGLKKFLIQNLDDGLSSGDLKGIQERLERISDLIHTSPAIAELFLSGSDFLDGLISCYKITNPPLRRALISTTFLCLVGLAEGQKFSALTDQLYSLKAAAAAHKSGPLNVNDSLVAELVTSTPLTQQLLRKLEESSDQVPTRTKSVLSELDTFKKPGSSLSKPKRLIRRKINKGKGVALLAEAHADHQQEMHIHRMSQISQVQDLFPELGSGFIAKLLDEYGDGNTEEVIAHLLDDSLPEHLRSADRSEQLSAATTTTTTKSSALPPRSTPPSRPAYLSEDEDEVEDLALLTSSNLQIGKSSSKTADSLLSAHPTSTQKASILSALAAFDSDDDERDDTYDAADVGGTVDASQGDEILPDGAEAHLFRAWSANPKLFERAPGARRSAERGRLKEETGMSDEQVEGWGLMLERDGKLQKRLAGRYGEWDGRQSEIESRKGRWKEDFEDGEEAGSGSGSDFPGGGGRGGGGYRGRGRGGGGRGRDGHGGDGGGGAAPPPPDSEAARRRKEANKGSRANHNRRDQRAKKMARGGAFPG